MRHAVRAAEPGRGVVLTLLSRPEGTIRRCTGLPTQGKVGPLTDILVRGIPAKALAAIDAKAKQLGISRQEFLRRLLIGSTGSDSPVTSADLERSSLAFADLQDTPVIDQAWQ